MNEQLKIVITAANDTAKKAIKEVRDEIDKTTKSAEEGGKSISESMQAVAKGAAIAVGAIAAVTTALVAFGKSSLEAQKNISKLNTAFQAVGSTSKQANKTYQDLYRFMADSGAATEAAQQLALITTNEQDLAQWTKILQGVYATMGSTLPIESLAEAANETIKVGKVTGTMADALNWAGVSEDAFNEKLAKTASLSEREALVRNTLNSLYMNASVIYERNNKALLAYNQSQARLDIALAQAGKAILPLMTGLNNLATTLLTVLRPAFEVVSQVIIIFVNYIIIAVEWISAFFSLFSSGKSETEKVAEDIAATGSSANTATNNVSGLGNALGSAAEAAKELKKQTMGFDELNVVSSPTSSASGGAAGGGGGAIPMPDIPALTEGMPNISEFTADLEKAKEKARSILAIAGSIAAALALWKIADFVNTLVNTPKLIAMINDFTKKYGDEAFQKAFGKDAQETIKKAQGAYDDLISKLKMWGGLLLIVAGAILLVQGYSDAWVNGIDWANFGVILGGLALIIGGLALAFGPMAAGIGTIAGGIALVVLGVKDFVENGYSMQNVLTILAGVIAVVVGVCLAFNAALLANPITWIVIAIAALVAAFVILWNECEGFRNFWINLWEKVKQLFAAFIKSMEPLIDSLVSAFKAAWELIKIIWNNYLVPLFKAAWEAIKAVWDTVKPYFVMCWENIKVVFSVVKEVLSAYFKAAWEAIKVVWNQVVAYFTAIWDTIAGIFSVVKAVLTGNWQEAWEGIKGIVNTWKDYFSKTWDNIKRIFSVVGTFFKDAFGAAWTGIKQIFSNVGTFFTGVWNTIKDIFSKTGTAIANAVSGAFTTAINWVLEKAIGIINGFIGAINSAIGIINKIPGVNITKISKLDVPKLAKGGVVDSATIAMIGEAGKEAVMPLENNTEWMNILADKIAARNSTPSKIVLKLNERELGLATIDAINGITMQNGGLLLTI